MNLRSAAAGLLLAVSLSAQTTPVSLPEVTVYSPRVANQAPAGAFAMPVSALRYEPQVDIQARNLTEAQSDVTIRGGIFENTGFRIGAVSQLDPQTGHYLAEIPVAPAMVGAPAILTGAEHAAETINSTVGAVTYGWRPVRTAGAASVAAGQFGLRRAELYQGYAGTEQIAGQRIAADVAWGRSESDGSIPFGEHHFDRVNARVQLASATSQTDFFAGYQAKFFGWPNLYTPFNSDETENLQTVLLALNHRANLGNGDYFEAGAYQRRNKDDYAFNRFAPVGAVHPFQHTTWENGAAMGGRTTADGLVFNYRAEMLADDLKSTSLTFGTFHTRTMGKVTFVPEKDWTLTGGDRVVAKAGATYDTANHGGSAGSPVLEIALEQTSSVLRRVYLSFARSTQLPSYTALNSNPAAGLFRGNPNLGREASRNLELGADGSLAGWTTQTAIFWRRDDALVDWTFRSGVTARTANPVDVDTVGAEVFARRSWNAFDLVLGYTALTKDANYRGAIVDASFYALNYARQRFTAAITARLGQGFELRMDNVARVQAANLLRVIGGNQAVTSSLGLAYRPPAWHGVELTLQADNLWNSDFQEVPAVPAARRQVSFGIASAW